MRSLIYGPSIILNVEFGIEMCVYIFCKIRLIFMCV